MWSWSSKMSHVRQISHSQLRMWWAQLVLSRTHNSINMRRWNVPSLLPPHSLCSPGGNVPASPHHPDGGSRTDLLAVENEPSLWSGAVVGGAWRKHQPPLICTNRRDAASPPRYRAARVSRGDTSGQVDALHLHGDPSSLPNTCVGKGSLWLRW